MRLLGNCIALLLLCSLAGCATAPPRHRDEATLLLKRAKWGGGEDLLPAEYRSTLEALQKGEEFLKRGDGEEAERYFQLALLKGALLEREVREERGRRREAARLAEAQKQAELEARQKAEAERQAKAKALAQAQARKEAAGVEHRKPKPQREYLPVSSYTVERGESLPLISSRPEVYGDRNLWPLIYRANRDQISDPRHIWPGQVLRIPRNLGRDDIAEARRYGMERASR